jgi:hypothetical protein
MCQSESARERGKKRQGHMMEGKEKETSNDGSHTMTPSFDYRNIRKKEEMLVTEEKEKNQKIVFLSDDRKGEKKEYACGTVTT